MFVYIYIQRFDEFMFKRGCKHDAFGQSSSKKGNITHEGGFKYVCYLQNCSNSTLLFFSSGLKPPSSSSL